MVTPFHASGSVAPAIALFGLDLVTLLTALVILISIAFLILVRRHSVRVAELEDALENAKSSRQSLATTYGRITEQFAPFLPAYPFDPKNFRFLGSPVDGVQFEDDRILFVEFKANTSRLTDREARFKQLVEEGRVGWFEFRVGDPGASRESPAAAEGPMDADAYDERPSSSWGAER